MLKQNLSISQEDYLETIFILSRSDGTARVKDIAARLNVAKASVNNAVKMLSDNGLLKYEPYEDIRLTGDGERYAANLFYKHRVLQQFLTDILVIDEDEAQRSACNMEHYLSDDSLYKLQRLLLYLQTSINQQEMKNFITQEGVI